ncbi:MAG TPA: PEGA domain-containing protein [Spirochaetota bacterium]|nr:PEGA domain-containing protein [Spirochaetota bacterium]
MQKKYLVFFFSLLSFFIFSLDITPEFIKRNDSQVLKDLFSCNIGIMQLKSVGKINQVNPLDTQNVVNAIKNNLDMVSSIKLSEKATLLKAIYSLKSKLSSSDKEKIEILERKVINSNDDIDNSYFYQFFLEFKKNTQFIDISKLWFENYNNPFYSTKALKPFLRISKDDKIICEMDTLKVSDNESIKGKFDFLFSGTIEKIDTLYFVTIYVYSYFDNKILTTFSLVSDSENLTSKINVEMENIIPQIFLINYGSLSIKTDDKETRIYLDSNYIGKGNEVINFLVPGRYIVVLKKENFNDKVENIYINDYEKKEIELKVDSEKELQTINFYIEPLGTKIFINSVYQGKTPFKKALPKGNYVISAKNPLYEDYRYFLDIEDIKKEELNVVFHLKSKNLKNYFETKKILYYTSFWNFTFGLTTTVPILIFAYDYFYKYGQAQFSYNTIHDIKPENHNLDKQYRYTDEGKNMYITQSVFYGLAWGFGLYSILGLGWLFFSLADYLSTKEKMDFVPIIEFYQNRDGDDALTLGLQMKIQ